jgi:outer membrane protein assembly factor BamB
MLHLATALASAPRVLAISCIALAMRSGAPTPHPRVAMEKPVEAATVAPRAAAAKHDWPMFGWDVSRSSAPRVPTGIDARNVTALVRQDVELDGVVDASVIYLHDVHVNGAMHDAFFVTTTYGKTIAVDASNGAILWTYTPPDFETWEGTAQITNSTPVADPGREFIYAASPDGRIQKLAVEDGHSLWRTAITLLPRREKIASPLGLWHGRVIAVTGGYIGDAPPYQGHVAILDAASGRLLRVWNSLCSDRAGLIAPASCPESGSAIWGRAGAIVDSTSGDIFVATGNGRWDGRTYWGDATLQLDSTATTLLGNYTPPNTDELAARDQDVGSTSPVLLGGGYLAQGGKDERIRVLSEERMRGPAAHREAPLQEVPTPSGARLFTAPAVLRTGDGTWLFAADNGGTAAWRFEDGKLHMQWADSNEGTSPVVADGLLYVYDPGGHLRIYEAVTGKLLTTLDASGGHWNSPIVVDGMIALPQGGARRGGSGGGVLSIWRGGTTREQGAESR